jgi:nucleoside-diphosphate-sugar epimerase
MDKRWLLVGGAGFIGSHLADQPLPQRPVEDRVGQAMAGLERQRPVA